MERDVIREDTFAPYQEGCGPTFRLVMWDTHRSPRPTRHAAETYLGYELSMDGTVLFTGEDYRCSPLNCIDDDASAACLMGFLTLRPGDTDADYFKDYTPEQLAFCAEHAEALSCCVMDQLGEY